MTVSRRGFLSSAAAILIAPGIAPKQICFRGVPLAVNPTLDGDRQAILSESDLRVLVLGTIQSLGQMSLREIGNNLIRYETMRHDA